MDEDTYFPDTDLESRFSSSTTATVGNFLSSTARSSLARSSLTLSFNESHLSCFTTTSTTATTIIHHRKWDPLWSAIKAATNLSFDGNLHLYHLKLIRHLGTGNLGRVFLCKLRDCQNATFALKVIDRDMLSDKKLSHVQTEAEVLSMLDHPFLPTLYSHIEASHYTCLLIDFCPKGDLHSLLHKQPGNRFPLATVRFFAAEVLVALEYLHTLGIIYRDLKPENILLREDGHIMLSDFDLCFRADVVPTVKFFRRQSGKSKRICFTDGCFGTVGDSLEVVPDFVAEPVNAFSRSCVGTHEYLAPELVSGNGHGNGVDWWAFGVFIYELLCGTTPFKGANKNSTLRNIVSSGHRRFLHKAEVEEAGMAEAKDLIEKLLVKDPRKRLGCSRGAQDIKQHPFFDGIKWSLIRHYKPPVVGGAVVSTKGHIDQPKRRRWFQKGIDCLMMRSTIKKGSYSYYFLGSNNTKLSNANYSDYVHNKNPSKSA